MIVNNIFDFVKKIDTTIYFDNIGSKSTFEGHWRLLRKYQPNGPLVNAEFYPGWFTHWQDPHSGQRDTQQVAESLRYYTWNNKL